MTKDRLIGIILALYPVLCIYASPVIVGSLGLLVMYLIVTPLLLLGVKKDFLNDPHVGKYFFFLLYSVLITIIWRGLGGNDFISYIINGIVLLLLLHHRKYQYFFLKSYVFLSALFSVFLIIQAIALYLFGIPINGILAFLPTALEEATSMRVSEYMEVARVSSVFLEPSHFALYVIPVFAIVIWDIGIVLKRKRKILVVLLIVTAILLSTSGNGLTLMMLIGLLYCFNRARGRNFIIVTIIATFVIGGGMYLASHSAIIGSTTEALLSTGDYHENSKSYYRVERGFELYADMPVYMEFLGVGYRNAENACQTFAPEIVAKYRTGDVIFEYFNSVAGILIYFGVIGFFLLGVFFAFVWRRSHSFGEKALLIVMFVSCISSSIFNTETWFFYIILTSAIIHGQYLKRLNQSKLLSK